MFARGWQFFLVFSSIVLGSLSISATVQAQDHIWSQSFGVWADDWGYSVACDCLGNIIITGRFGQNVSFGGKPLICPEGDGIFLAKYDADGNHIWSQGFVGSSSECSYSTAVDASGNAFITGYFTDSLDIAGEVLNAAGFYDIFLAKFDTDGSHIWSKQYGDEDFEVGFSVDADASGNVVLTGAFAGTVDFGGEPLTSNGGFDIFLVKFDTDGNHIWSQRFGDEGEWQSGYCVVADASGNIIAGGAFEGTVDFGGGPLTSDGAYDFFLVKFDADGNYLWSKQFHNNASSAEEFCIAIDAANSVIVSGSLAIAGDEDIFLAKLDTDGNHIWSKRIGDEASMQKGCGVAADASGNVVVTGMFWGTVDFGGGPLTCNGYHDIFLAKFDTDGNHIWSQQFGDDSWQVGYSVATDALENVIITGWFYSAVDFGGELLTTWGSNDDYDSRDIFLAKFGSNVTSGEIPLPTLVLSQNFPNPFNPLTRIQFNVPYASHVRLDIYDISGKFIRTLLNAEMEPGSKEIVWDGKDGAGHEAASGVYFYRITAGSYTETKKMVLLK